jgi:hypothetical protein
MSSVKNITSILEAFENENALNFYVPTLKREVKFKTFNIGQQKKILKATIDNPVFQTRFIIAMYEVLNENCCEDLKKLNLSVIDYNSILLQYRKNVYGDTITINSDDIEYKANINESIEKINAIQTFSEQEIVEGSISITLKTPTLKEQYQIEKELRDGKSNDEQIINGASNIGTTLGDAFIGELSKYVKEITLTRGEERIQAGYGSLTFTDKLKLIEQLPSSLVKKSLPAIGEMTSKLTEALQVVGVSTENNSKIVSITIDSSLFPVE